jgi:arginyl-tRNA synthetase
MVTRVLLCEAAKRILQTAFSLVSIETIEKI